MIKRLTNRHLILSYMLKHDPDILMLPNVHQIYPTLYLSDEDHQISFKAYINKLVILMHL